MLDAYTDAYGGISLFDGVNTNSLLNPTLVIFTGINRKLHPDGPFATKVSTSACKRLRIKQIWNLPLAGYHYDRESGFYVERRTGTVGDWSPLVTLGKYYGFTRDNNLDNSLTFITTGSSLLIIQ